MDSLSESLIRVWADLQEAVVAWTPRVVLGLVLLVLALVVAKGTEWVLRGLLRRLRLGDLASRTGVEDGLRRIGVRQSVDRFVPRLVYYLLLVLFARTGADALGLVAISDAIASFMGYLPNIAAALLILILGSAAAQFAGRAVSEAAASSGIEFASSLGRVVSWILLLVLGVMAVGQLRIDTEVIRLVMAAVLAAFALAFGLSFGLGTREITRNIIAGFYARKTFELGEELELSGEKGVLTAITPTQTLLRQGDRLVGVANSVFLEQVVKQ